MANSTPNLTSTLGSTGNGSGMGTDPMVERMTQGAHQAVDRLAEKAGPAIGRLRSTVAGASDSLHQQADQLNEMQKEWMETARTCVREHPLATIAVALAAGVLIARLASSR